MITLRFNPADGTVRIVNPETGAIGEPIYVAISKARWSGSIGKSCSTQRGLNKTQRRRGQRLLPKEN